MVNSRYGKTPNTVKQIFPWATTWDRLLGRQCKAVLPRMDGIIYWGRCELVKNHICDHALERGFETPQWKIKITSN